MASIKSKSIKKIGKTVPAKKQPKKAINQETTEPVRKLKRPAYQSFKLQKRIKHQIPRVDSGTKIFRESLKLIWKQKRFFIKYGIIYSFLILFLVKKLGGGINVAEVKSSFQEYLKGDFDNLNTSLTLYGLLVGSALNTASDSARIYQSIFLLMFSLAAIWALREFVAGRKVAQLRDAFYKGMGPIVPFLFVFLVVLLELIPFYIVQSVYGYAIAQYFIVSAVEQGVWLFILFLGAVASLYLMSSTIFALYIVCLPDMTPTRARLAARKIVNLRRFMVVRRIAVLPLYMILLGAVLMLPVIFFVPRFSEIMFYITLMIFLPLVHTYLYKLYRQLLKEAPKIEEMISGEPL